MSEVRRADSPESTVSRFPFGDAIATAATIRAGEVSAREVVEAAIGRIGDLNPRLNAVVATRFDEALEEADAGLPDGPLRGVPVLVKDLGAAVAGLPATRGSRLWSGCIAPADSELVRRYRRAGMVVLGMTNTSELGRNASVEPLLFGPTRNPWLETHSTGGSSGGSAAAVSAGMVPVAHGNDGGGSIRIPAAMCGLVGLKPSRGRVSPAPYPSTLAAPMSAQHALSTSVRDSAVLLDIAAGALPGEALAEPARHGSFLDAVGRDPGRLRIGLTTMLPGGVHTDPQAVEAVLSAARTCADLGHDVIPVETPWDPAEVGASFSTLMAAELIATVEERLHELGRELREDDLEPFTAFMVEYYRSLPAAEANRALRDAQRIGWSVGQAFEGLDVMLTPVLARPALRLGEMDTTRPETMYELGPLMTAWTSVANLTGMPAMSLPWSLHDSGIPIGVQLLSLLGTEERLLSLAGQLEAAHPWRCQPRSVGQPWPHT